METNGQSTLMERIKARIPPRLESWWEEVKSTLWFLPAIAVIIAVVLALMLVYVDDTVDKLLQQRSSEAPWLYGAGADGARGVLTSIATAVMTVIGTVFSITIVALQLAASQFTPRVLRQFTGDRINQTVLAVFIGTFTYSLLVLRTVQGPTERSVAFVPLIAVSVAILLALACIGLLIIFIHHMAQQTQVSYILHRASQDALWLVETYFREDVTPPPPLTVRNYAQGDGHDVLSTSSGYLQHYDNEFLLSTARSSNLTIRMLVPMGAYLNTRQPIARIWTSNGEEVDLDQAANAVRAAFVTGPERTLAADLPLGVRQIVDIALKAISPAINDPTTATQAIDRLSEVLARAGALEAPVRILYVDDRPAVFLPRIGFEELTNIAFTQLRHYSNGDLVVMLHLTRAIERIATLVHETHRPVLLRHLELLRAAGMQGLPLSPERETLSAAVDEAVARVTTPGDGERMPPVADILREM